MPVASTHAPEFTLPSSCCPFPPRQTIPAKVLPRIPSAVSSSRPPTCSEPPDPPRDGGVLPGAFMSGRPANLSSLIPPSAPWHSCPPHPSVGDTERPLPAQHSEPESSTSAASSKGLSSMTVDSITVSSSTTAEASPAVESGISSMSATGALAPCPLPLPRPPLPPTDGRRNGCSAQSPNKGDRLRANKCSSLRVERAHEGRRSRRGLASLLLLTLAVCCYVSIFLAVVALRPLRLVGDLVLYRLQTARHGRDLLRLLIHL